MLRIYRLPITVTEDCIDVLGHTNNKEYLRWMEEAAISHSDALGWNMERYLKLGAAFAATVHKIHYLRPTHVGDELIMNTWVETLEKTISRRAFYLTRGGKVCMNGTTEWTFINLKTAGPKKSSGGCRGIPNCSERRPLIEGKRYSMAGNSLNSERPAAVA